MRTRTRRTTKAAPRSGRIVLIRDGQLVPRAVALVDALPARRTHAPSDAGRPTRRS